MFVSTDTAKDARQLARQMARGEVRTTSVAWSTGLNGRILEPVQGRQQCQTPNRSAIRDCCSSKHGGGLPEGRALLHA